MMDFWTIMGTSIWNKKYRKYIDQLCRQENPQEALFNELVLKEKKLLTRFEIGEIVRYFNTDRGHETRDAKVLMNGIRALIAKQMEGLRDRKSAFLYLIIMDTDFRNLVLAEKLQEIPCYEKFEIDSQDLKFFQRLMRLERMKEVMELFQNGRWTVTQDCPTLISMNQKYDHANAASELLRLENRRRGTGSG